ncbi:MAG TPA: cytochrome c3 family protein, partial [Chthoniobacteraceae bacterium]|nr:cytochrome c3 family protein [Chthoniobacteraceae bacterium]
MAQIFSPRSNTVARLALVCVVLGISGGGWLLSAVYWSPYSTWVGVPREQPVPFSHKHHVDGLGIDCRYCHTTV